MNRRRRIIWGIATGGLLMLAGAAALFQRLIPITCLVPAVLAETIGIWLLVHTVKRNAGYKREGSPNRSFVPFGFAVFLILFGVGLTLASFKLIPDVVWSVVALFSALGGTFIYRALVLPNSNGEKNDSDDKNGSC